MRVLAIDVGTSSTRAIVYGGGGKRVDGPGGRRSYTPRTTPDGGSEIDADVLVDHVERCIDEAATDGVDAVAVCTFLHGLVGVDACNSFGSGATGRDRGALRVGTSGALRLFQEAAVSEASVPWATVAGPGWPPAPHPRSRRCASASIPPPSV